MNHSIGKLLASFFALVLLTGSCKNQEKKEEAAIVPVSMDTAATKQNYMPIQVILQGELKWVEDYAGAILLKSSSENKKDSAYISLDQFKQLGKSVISSDLDSAYFNEHFKEESIVDAASNGLTFVYTGADTREVKKVMAYITRTETSDKVGRVYFERAFTSGDTAIVQRCTWKLHHYLMIVSTRQVGNGASTTQVQKAIYDPADINE